MPNRARANDGASWVSGVAALPRLLLDAVHRLSCGTLPPWVGPVVVGLSILPPNLVAAGNPCRVIRELGGA